MEDIVVDMEVVATSVNVLLGTMADTVNMVDICWAMKYNSQLTKQELQNIIKWVDCV